MFDFNEEIIKLTEKSEKMSFSAFQKIEEVRNYNAKKVLTAFIENRVSDVHLKGTTGYGYNDMGRETLEKVVAQSFGCEDALVRYSILSGTHALTIALFGILRPGDTMVCVSGTPYDTIHKVIGIGGDYGYGSLKEFGINYEEIKLVNNDFDYEKIRNYVKEKAPKMVYIQRSRGYTQRKALSVSKINKVNEIVKEVSPDTVLMVDNCYGEFTEKTEPNADLLVGSLIKNAGGGIAKMGGYIAGNKNCVELCSYRLTAPGVGAEIGATLDGLRDMFLGFYMSPCVVADALKTAVLCGTMFKEMGYKISPDTEDERSDIIQSVILETPENVISFCKSIQGASPIDSFASPEPDAMPGYDNDIIMASGSFTSGSSIEISADAPIRPPYAVYMQGGINYATARIAIMNAAQNLKERQK